MKEIGGPRELGSSPVKGDHTSGSGRFNIQDPPDNGRPNRSDRLRLESPKPARRNGVRNQGYTGSRNPCREVVYEAMNPFRTAGLPAFTRVGSPDYLQARTELEGYGREATPTALGRIPAEGLGGRVGLPLGPTGPAKMVGSDRVLGPGETALGPRPAGPPGGVWNLQSDFQD